MMQLSFAPGFEKRPVTMLDFRLAEQMLGKDLERKAQTIDQQIEEALNGLVESLKFVKSFNTALMQDDQKKRVYQMIQDEQKKVEVIRTLYEQLQRVLEDSTKNLRTIKKEIDDNLPLSELKKDQAEKIRRVLQKGSIRNLFIGFVGGIVASIIRAILYNRFFS